MREINNDKENLKIQGFHRRNVLCKVVVGVVLYLNGVFHKDLAKDI